MRRPEEPLHRSIVQWLAYRLKPGWLFWHTPNGGGRSKAEAGILKALGVRAGMPDLLVLGPGPVLLAIEIKPPPVTLKSGAVSQAKPRVSPAQEQVMRDLADCGVTVCVARSIEDVAAALSQIESTRSRREIIDAAILAKPNGLGARS